MSWAAVVSGKARHDSLSPASAVPPFVQPLSHSPSVLSSPTTPAPLPVTELSHTSARPARRRLHSDPTRLQQSQPHSKSNRQPAQPLQQHHHHPQKQQHSQSQSQPQPQSQSQSQPQPQPQPHLRHQQQTPQHLLHHHNHLHQPKPQTPQCHSLPPPSLTPDVTAHTYSPYSPKPLLTRTPSPSSNPDADTDSSVKSPSLTQSPSSQKNRRNRRPNSPTPLSHSSTSPLQTASSAATSLSPLASPSKSLPHTPSPPPYQPQLFDPCLWNDPRNVARYRFWAHHISNFMAHPVQFFHMFVFNQPFQQSVSHTGLTFHPDTDPTNPVLINLNSTTFGMSNRISALTPPASLVARFANATSSAPQTPTSPPNQPLSPLSDHSQPHQHPPTPLSLSSPAVNNIIDQTHSTIPNSFSMNSDAPPSYSSSLNQHPHQFTPTVHPPSAVLPPNPIPTPTTPALNAAYHHPPPTSTPINPDLVAHNLGANGDPPTPHDFLPSAIHAAPPLELLPTPDGFNRADDVLAQHFADTVHIEASDTDSERHSDVEYAVYPSPIPVHHIYTYDPNLLIPVPIHRRTGRSKVVSRKLNVRVPTHPTCKTQSDKAKVELIEQIEDIVPQVTPPEDYSQVREDLISRLRKVIKAEWPKADIHVYGSAGNGLGLRSADVDTSLYMPTELALSGSKENGNTASALKSSAKAILARLAAIMQENRIEVLTRLLDARVPVIKMLDPISGLQVDVCVNNILAVRNTELIQAYVNLDPRFRYVCILVKRWAKKRDLNDAYNGTLSSYAYTLMVIHYLQTLQPPVLPCLQHMVRGKRVRSGATLPQELTDNGSNKLYNTYFDRSVTPETWKSRNLSPVHELLLGFFKYYAFNFKNKTDLVSIRLGTRAPRSVRKWDEETVYREWERKQKQYREATEAALVKAFEARARSDSYDHKAGDKGELKGSISNGGTDNYSRMERIQYPRPPRLESKHLFCIEDPFDIDHDLSRGMEKAAVYVIRQEMVRAYEILAETGDYEFACVDFGFG